MSTNVQRSGSLDMTKRKLVSKQSSIKSFIYKDTKTVPKKPQNFANNATSTPETKKKKVNPRIALYKL